MTLRILTLNTWKCDGLYRRRLNHMAQRLEELNPDVVLLQEVFATEDGQVDTAAYLAKHLAMAVTHAPARRKSRWFEERHCPSSSGLAVLTRQPVVEHHVVALPTDEDDGERIAQIVKVVHQGNSFWVANLHLTHLPTAAKLRSSQLATCLSALRQHAGLGFSVIGGDFNTGPGNPEFDALLIPPWHLVNPFGSMKKTTYRTEDGQDLDLDHLLLSGWSAGSSLAAKVTPAPSSDDACHDISDHAAVLLDLNVGFSTDIESSADADDCR